MTDTTQQILSALQARFDAGISEVSEPGGLLSVTVETGRICEVMTFLKQECDPAFNFLTDLCGVHDPGRPSRELSVVYHLHSLTANIRLRLRVFTGADQPVVPSVTKVFASANWMERETFDFFGIRFTGHPNLSRILNMDDMAWHPLLKQYPLEDQTREDKEDKFFGR